MSVSFRPSQTGRSGAVPLAWTANPLSLLWSDTKLFFANFNNLFGVLVPGPVHPLDEMYLSAGNLWTLSIHMFLIAYQLAFLVSIPIFLLLIPIPGVWFLFYCALVLGFNKLVCLFLNGPAYLDSRIDLSKDETHPSERWIFLNGVSVGSHWLQANIDRLAMTFRRPVRGVHNRTDGFIFDLIQCIIERNFSYSTQDVREAYVQIKDALIDGSYEKVVLILHSQGGIQGSLIVNWLLDELPQSFLSQLEIYTFGNAANHFNNPHRDKDSFLNARKAPSRGPKSISYIEHYGNSGDFVAQWGVLHFTSVRNRFMGRIFTRAGNGHLLNQHYLNAMFQLGEDGYVLDRNTFMEMPLETGTHSSKEANGILPPEYEQKLSGGDSREGMIDSLLGELRPDGFDGEPSVHDVNTPVTPVATRSSVTVRVKDFSRLWQYRNGRCPRR